MLLRGLPTGNDRLQKDAILRFDKGHEIDVALDSNLVDLLPGVAFLVRMVICFKDVTRLDVEDDFLERYSSLSFEKFILGRVPRDQLHVRNLAQRVPIVLGRLTPALTGAERTQ